MPTLSEIASGLDRARLVVTSDIEIEGITHDSREVKKGFLFAAMKGQNSDGSEFVSSAIENGAAAILCDHKLDADIPQIVVADPRSVLGEVSSACYGRPTEDLVLVGITGTNGKTSIAYLIEAALLACNKKPGVMGTIEHRIGAKRWSASNTTPEATVVQSIARQMLDRGATHMVMEVSSHGLVLHRLDGCRFDVVAFTNLTQDHLDFHKDMDDYARAKMLLFTRALEGNPSATAVLNEDDPFACRIIKKLRHPHVTVSCNEESGADFRPVEQPRYDIEGVETVGGEGGVKSN